MALEKKNYDPATKYGAVDSETDMAVTQGSIVIGDSSGKGTELSVKDDGKILVGNGTTATSVAVSGDITLTNAGVAAIASGVIVNADVKSDAAIAFSKLAALTDTNILVGNGSNVATAVAISGDATMANTGALTIANDAVDKAKLDYEVVTVSISGASSGTGTCTTGSEIIGYHETAFTGTERVKTVDVSGTTVTVTLTGSDTATVKVILIKA